jgi:hypothetical protein
VAFEGTEVVIEAGLLGPRSNSLAEAGSAFTNLLKKNISHIKFLLH